MSNKARTASRKYLEKLGVTIYTETVVKDYDGQTLLLQNGEIIQTKTVIWAAGVTGNKIEGLANDLITPSNRIKVDRFSKVVNSINIYALGDVACMETPKYPKGHPQIANVAINQAKLLAKNLKRINQHKTPVKF